MNRVHTNLNLNSKEKDRGETKDENYDLIHVLDLRKDGEKALGFKVKNYLPPLKAPHLKAIIPPTL
jgi:hypothetical protein